MRRYFSIYKQLIKLNLATLFTYRVNFVNNILASVGWGAMSLLTIILLTSRIGTAYGWRRDELLLFNGIYGVIIGIFHMFISINMGRLSRVIHMGELDGILMKPIDSQFAVSVWQINFSTIFRIFMAMAYTVWMIQRLRISVTIWHLLSFTILSAASLGLLYSIWFLVLTNLMWFSNLSNLVLLLYSYESMARFPKEMLFQLGGLALYTVFPLAIAINTPARAMIGRLGLWDALVLCLISIGFWAGARMYWRFALRHYASASS